MFHEFGHAVLNRPHKNDKFPNASSQSIMNSNALDFIMNLPLN